MKITNISGKTKRKKEDKKLIFKGTDYLGITQNIEFREYIIEGFSKYGSSFGGSRLSGTFADLYTTAENRLSEIAKAKAALTFSSGTLSGMAVLNVLDKDKEFIYAPDVHPALSPYRNSNNISFDLWKENLLKNIKKNNKALTILSNSLNPLSVENFNFEWIQEIAHKRPVTLIIDDSHGFGILGKEGTGIYNELPDNENIERVVISSLGKAWGLPGGVVLASKKIINKLQASSLFGGASPIIPAYLYAFLQSEHIYTNKREELKNNINLFLNNINDKNQYKYFQDFPVFSSKNHELYDILLNQNIEISSFNYPSPDAERYTRVVLSALHSEKDIIELCRAILNAQF